MPKFYQMNVFYEALIALEKFETGSATNAQSCVFFALNRIASLLIEASNKGNVIAPFFLHYLHQTYPKLGLDPTLLPNLDEIPTHRSKAEYWLQAYKQYIKMMAEIQALPESFIIYVEKERDAKKKEKFLKNRHKDIKAGIKKLTSIDTPIAQMLYAKCYEKYNQLESISVSQSELDKQKLLSYLQELLQLAAETPNHWAMLEYVGFMDRYQLPLLTPLRDQKIRHDLQMISDNNGSFYPLHQEYKAQKNERSSGQWLIQAALNGEENALPQFYSLYCESIQTWSTPISYPDALIQSRMWAEIIYQTEHTQTIFILIDRLANQIEEFLAAPTKSPNPKKYVSHLVIMTYRMIEIIDKTTNQGDVPICASSSAVYIYHNRSQLLEAFWQAYEGQLPNFAKENKHILTEIALIFDNSKNFPQAQLLYEQAYKIAPADPIAQYNLGNVLFSQSQNDELERQISLFMQAASAGCHDSTERLVFLVVLKALDFDVDFTLIQGFVEAYPGDSFDGHTGHHKIKLPKSFILSLIDLKIEADLFEQQEKERNSLDEKASLEDTSPISKTEHDIAENIQDSPIVTSPAPNFFPHVKQKTKKPAQPKDIIPTTDACLQEEIEKETCYSPKQEKALEALHALANKPLRSYTFEDIRRTHQYMHILSGGQGPIKISNKGRSSGSRVSIAGHTYHRPHSNDRMVIGAQADLRGVIDQAIETHTPSELNAHVTHASKLAVHNL